MSKSKAAAILALGLLGCVHSDVPLPFDVAVVDRPDLKAFEITLTSRATRAFCFTPEFWPNPAGRLSAAAQVASVDVDGRTFATLRFNQGYCPGLDCAVRVRPGQTISGRLSYATFDLPAELADEPKVLRFSPLAVAC
jgi:hypothetical protein